MNCADVQEWLERDLDGVAEPSADVAAHLDLCEGCAAVAGRQKAITEAARAVLPEAGVPAGFTERVLEAAAPATADRALLEAVRPRRARFTVVLVLLFLLPGFFFVWPREERAGDLVYVPKDGGWVARAMPVKDAVFGMEPQTGTVLETVSVDALARSLLRATYPVEFIVGRVRLNCKEPAVIRTPLGIMNLEAGTECVATVTNEETTVMSSFDTLKRVAPSALLVTVLSGGVQTTYAQEAPAPVQPREPVAAKPVEEPRVTVRFENMKIQVAIRLIASKAKRRVVIDHALEGSLTTNLKSIPWRQALTLMGETCNFVWHEDGQGVLYVMRKAKQQNQETLPWHLDRALTQHDAQSIKRLKEWAAEIDRVLRRVDPNARQGVLGQLIPQPRVVDIRVGAVDAVVVRPANGAGGRAGNGVVGRPATGAAAVAALVRLQADAEVKDLQKRFAALETRLAAAKALLATASRQHLPNAYLSRLQEAEEIKLRIARCQAAVDQAAKAGDNAAAEEALRKYSLARQAWVAHSRLKKTEATIARFVAQGEYEAARAAADECARKKRDLDKILRTLRPQPDVK